MILIQNDYFTLSIELDETIHFHYDSKESFVTCEDIYFDELRNNEGNKEFEHGFSVDNRTAYFQFLTDWTNLIREKRGRIKIDQMDCLNNQIIEFTTRGNKLAMKWVNPNCIIYDEFEWETVRDVKIDKTDYPELKKDYWVIIGEGDAPQCYQR